MGKNRWKEIKKGKKRREREREKQKWVCCRKGDPFQGLKAVFCLTLGNECLKRHTADKARDFTG